MSNLQYFLGGAAFFLLIASQVAAVIFVSNSRHESMAAEQPKREPADPRVRHLWQFG
jgi:hypothetical protein